MSKRKCIGLFLMLFSLGSLNGVAQEIAFSDESYEQALKQAKQEKKPVFIDFYATWCGPCKRLSETVFTDPEVKAYYDKHFVCVRVDVDKERILARKYQIQSMPTLVFLDENGKEQKRISGLLSKTRFLHIGQELTGERRTYPELYKEFRNGKKDLAVMQTLLTEAPDFIRELDGQERIKWRERANEIFKTYVPLKKLDHMINNLDFQIIMLYHEKVGRDDSVLNFVNKHCEEFEKIIEPHVVWEFILSRQNGLINALAKAGDRAYLEELKRIDGDMRVVYAKIKYPHLSVYNVMKSQSDGIYALYAEKNEGKFIDLKEDYFNQVGEFLTFTDYREAIQELVIARKGVLSSQSYERLLVWLERASKLKLQPQEQLDMSCLMGNCFRGLENYKKAKSCFNQAYILAMQLGDARMQARIKRVLEQMPDE